MVYILCLFLVFLFSPQSYYFFFIYASIFENNFAVFTISNFSTQIDHSILQKNTIILASLQKKLYLCEPICVFMKKVLFILLLLPLCFAACRPPAVPKPYGYFRIAIPDTLYTDYAPVNYPYAFRLSSNAEIISINKTGEPFWIDIYYPTLNTTIHCSYKPIRNNLRTLARDAQEFLFSHSNIASAIPSQEYANPEHKVYGVYYELHGNTASPIQFVLTDSIEHFFRGSVYCNDIPNQDSLAPIYNYIRHDVRTLMESIKWQ